MKIIRRNFFKSAIGTIISIFGFGGVKSLAKSTKPIQPSPLFLFEQFKMLPGEIPEFPLDFIFSDKQDNISTIYLNDNKNIVQKGGDTVIIPTYEVIGKGKTVEEAESAYTEQLNNIVLDTFLSAGRANKEFIENNKETLIEEFRKYFNNEHITLLFEHKGYLIGINKKLGQEYYVIPFIEEKMIYKELDEFIIRSKQGCGVLNCSCVVTGKIK